MAPLDQPPVGERAERALRILDTATDLLVAWGYRRVTIDDVARRAGVGKGTVYLHFPTKEVLFLTVLERSRIHMIESTVRDLGADPAAVLPSAQARSAYLMIHRDPVARAVFTGDVETLGELARIARSQTANHEFRQEVQREYFTMLRELGLVRRDMPLDRQIHAYSAVMTGFIMIEPLLATEMNQAEEKAETLAQVISSALETEPGPDALRAAVDRAVPLYHRLLRHLREEAGRHAPV